MEPNIYRSIGMGSMAPAAAKGSTHLSLAFESAPHHKPGSVRFSGQLRHLQGNGSLERKKGPIFLALPTMLPSPLKLIASPAPHPQVISSLHPSHSLASAISSKAWAPLLIQQLVSNCSGYPRAHRGVVTLQNGSKDSYSNNTSN